MKQGKGLKDAFIELSFEQAEKHDELVQSSVEMAEDNIVLAEDNAVLEGVARVLTEDNAWLVEKLLEVSPKQRKVTESLQKSKATRETNLDKKHRLIREAAIERWRKKPSHSTNAVAEYLIDEEITTLKIRQVTEIIKHLKPPQ